MPGNLLDAAKLRWRRLQTTWVAMDRGKRTRVALLTGLFLLLVGVSGLWAYYLRTRKPITAVLPPAPAVAQVFKPRYLFSIYGVTAPIGVAATPPGDRIYVTESGGERLVRAFDRDGRELFTFSPPGSSPASRSPVYVALDNGGNVYVTDRLQHAIYVYTADGQYLDTILSPAVRLRDWARSNGGPEYAAPGLSYIYLFGQKEVLVRKPDGESLDPLPVPDYTVWAPLGINVVDNTLYITELTMGYHRVMALDMKDGDVHLEFGTQGQDRGQFYYPNGTAVDAQRRIYVSDSNNGRLQVFSSRGEHLAILNTGVGGSRMSMPRGVWIDSQDRLYVVDTVGQTVHTYHVDDSGELEPLFTFGSPGVDDSQFNYPNDIAVDDRGRLYVTDTFNNRVQVWTY